MMISLKITPKFNLSRVQEMIDMLVASRVNAVARAAWRNVVAVDHPYWSGSYISSWRFTIGGGATISWNKPEWPDYQTFPDRDQFDAPGEEIPEVHDPYTLVTISNAAPHAMMVEYEGTPRHPHPWEIATQAWLAARMAGASSVRYV